MIYIQTNVYIHINTKILKWRRYERLCTDFVLRYLWYIVEILCVTPVVNHINLLHFRAGIIAK